MRLVFPPLCILSNAEGLLGQGGPPRVSIRGHGTEQNESENRFSGGKKIFVKAWILVWER